MKKVAKSQIRSAPARAGRKKARASTARNAASGNGRELQIGGRLKHARLLTGIRIRELAVKVNCTESMISKIENGRVVPSLPMLQRLVEALGSRPRPRSSARTRTRRA